MAARGGGVCGDGPEVCPRPQDVASPAWADADADGAVDVADGLRIARASLSGGPPVACDGQGDLTGSGDVAIEASNQIWNWLFVGSASRLPELDGCPLRRQAPEGPCSGVELDIDAPARVDATGGTAAFDATIRLHADDLYPEAWSFGVGADGCTITGVSRGGTRADSVFHGGLFDAGFAREQVVDGGAVSAAVLSWRTPIALSAGDPQPVLTVHVEAPAPASGCARCALSFRDGLKGDGQPVAVVVAAAGHAYEPTRREAEVKVCAP